MEQTPAPDEEELPELDPVDPLKRDPETEGMPGLDPVILPVPPE